MAKRQSSQTLIKKDAIESLLVEVAVLAESVHRIEERQKVLEHAFVLSSTESLRVGLKVEALQAAVTEEHGEFEKKLALVIRGFKKKIKTRSEKDNRAAGSGVRRAVKGKKPPRAGGLRRRLRR